MSVDVRQEGEVFRIWNAGLHLIRFIFSGKSIVIEMQKITRRPKNISVSHIETAWAVSWSDPLLKFSCVETLMLGRDFAFS
jgi:hypothetical protein